MFALGQLVIEGQPSVLGETVPAGVAAIKAPGAWDASKKAIKVAVLDTGIDPALRDLIANLRLGMSFLQQRDEHRRLQWAGPTARVVLLPP